MLYYVYRIRFKSLILKIYCRTAIWLLLLSNNRKNIKNFNIFVKLRLSKVVKKLNSKRFSKIADKINKFFI